MAVAGILSLSFIMVSLSDAALYYVTEDGLDCPSNSTCKTLSFYSRVPGDYFVNDTIFHFLEGTHLLDHSIQVSGVTNITFRGVSKTRLQETVSEPLSVITCPNGSGSIVFNQQSRTLHLSYLTIRNCSRNYSAALVFHESYDINLTHLAILNCSGYGLLVANGYGTNIESSTFANNWINSYIVYSPPELCFNNLNKYTLNIISSNFTNSKYRYTPSVSTGYGLVVIVRTQLTYQVVTQLDHVTALNNTFSNIAFVIFDGHPHSLVITNTISSAGIFGLFVYTEDILLETDCTSFSPTNDFIDANITVSDSQFINNFVGIRTLFDIFLPYVGTSSLQFEIIRCIVSWNKRTGIHWDRNLDKINSLTLKIQDSVIQYNSYLIEDSAIFVYRTSTYLENNLISNNYQAGLVVLDSEVIVSGTKNVFRNNSGFDGGAVALLHSDLLIAQDSNIAFIDNAALRKGGALYIDRVCGLQILNDESNNTLNNVTLSFINNSALIGGDIYGLTSPLNCLINVGNIHDVVYLNTFEEKQLQSSTDSVGVCPCDDDDSLMTCFQDTHGSYRLISQPMSLHPGEVIEVPIVVVGFGGEDTYALTDGIIDLDVDGKEVSNIPYNGTYCYKLTYTVTQSSSENNKTEILIRSDPSYLNFVSVSTQPGIRIQVTFLPCPEGFKLVDGKCECTGVLRNTQANINCNITSEEISVTRGGPKWYGKWTEKDDCYVIDTTCGYNYCQEGMVTFDLMNRTDEQCNFNRHGLLCSQCPDGQSLQLGSNKCGSCHNFSLSLLIVFVLAGIGLVGLIIALNLTVSVGTINGLIFYANIVKMYEHIFFPHESIPFVSQFISWLNLDLGITMCFYDGMDTYSKSWLQFVFPFYIWLLILLIITLCKLSPRLSQLLGSHVVPVLATLFLLSYIKLMRSIVFVLGAQKVTVACNDGTEDQIRWLADPSMRYLSFKHAVIFTFAVTLLVIFVIPYTLALLFSPLLQGYLSKFRYCSFWNNFKPVFDAYNAPYKDKLRFWPGFLLLIRIPILVAASVENSFNTDKNALLSVALISIVIALTTSNIVGGVYRIWYLNVLETGFLLNAAVLAVAATNDVNSNTYKAILIISILVSFLAFVVIIIFHVYLKLSKGGYKGTELKMQMLADKFKSQKGATPNRVYRDSLEWYMHSTTERKGSNESILSDNLMRRESLLFDEHANDYMIVTDSTIRGTN